MQLNTYSAKDEQLFKEVQKLMDGQYDSYQNVYELSRKYIYKVIYDIVQDHYTTEDMMQETYLQVYNKIGSLREAQAFYVWVGRIASNLTLRYLQKYRHEVLTETTDDDEEDFIFDKMVNDNEAFIPESVLENQEQQRIIAAILEGLSPEQKLTVQYFYYEEMSVNDIAALMECSAGTVKSRLNYARKSLKTAVSQFETDNNVKLYSLSGLPIFFLVFKDLCEALVLAAQASGTAAVAGGSMIGSASMAGGTVGSNAAIAGGTAISGGEVVTGMAESIDAAVSGGTATVGGTAGGSTVTAGGTAGGNVAAAGSSVISGGGAAIGADGEAAEAAETTGGARASGAMSGFMGTVAGKVAVAAVVVVMGGAVAIAVTQSQSSQNDVPVVETVGNTQEKENNLSEGIFGAEENVDNSVEGNQQVTNEIIPEEEDQPQATPVRRRDPFVEPPSTSTTDNIYAPIWELERDEKNFDVNTEEIYHIVTEGSESILHGIEFSYGIMGGLILDENWYKKDKESLYDSNGELIYYEIYRYDEEERWISKGIYYPDGTPWVIRERSNFIRSADPAGSKYDRMAYTLTTIWYYPDGEIYRHEEEDRVLHGSKQRVDDVGSITKLISYYPDGTIEYMHTYEYIQIKGDDKWGTVKASYYDSDGILEEYYTYEMDENGRVLKTNWFDGNGNLHQ